MVRPAPILHLVCGKPAAGKSTLTARLGAADDTRVISEDSWLAALYGAAYYVFEEKEDDRWARAVQQYVIHLLPHETKSPKRLLDVGCALGHVAALAQRRGWRVTGIDISASAVSRARSPSSNGRRAPCSRGARNSGSPHSAASTAATSSECATSGCCLPSRFSFAQATMRLNSCFGRG